ncbi:MAG: hypothetical protein K8I30_07725, partial [Anaerolineae bacterium]|nr:hypothetical protein [Anaerolineae bacterium]
MNLSDMTPTRLRLILSVFWVCWFSLGVTLAQTPEATETPQPKLDINGYQLTFDVDSSHAGFTIDDLRAAADVIARRFEALDVAPFQVQIVNQSSIQVQFPGAEDPQVVTETLTQIALLELVDFTGLNDKVVQFEGLTIQTAARESVTEGQVNPLTGDPFDTVLTGADLKDAHAEVASYDPNQWIITFELTPEAGKIFGDYTGSHIGEPLAIVLDG